MGFRSLAKTIHTTTPTRRLVFHLFGAPVASWPLTGNGSIRWSEITYTLDRKPMMDHAKMFGLRYGACFAVNEDNHKSFLTLSHKEREFTDGEIADLHAKFITWHSFVNRLVELTEDEKEVLRLFQSGLNRRGVAKAAEVCEATVKRRMHVRTRRYSASHGASGRVCNRLGIHPMVR